MPRIIRHRVSAARWWPTLAAGAALGAVGAWLVLRANRAAPAGLAADPLPRPRGTSREPDLDAMSARLRELPGAEQLRLRSLGGGILELVGSATAELDVRALLATLAAEPRVSVVVNRVWTPDSMAAESDLDAPGPRTDGEP